MNKTEIAYYSKEIERAITIAKKSLNNNLPLRLELFSKIGDYSERLLTYAIETEDFALMERLSSLERYWLVRLNSDYELPTEISYSINKCTRNLIDMGGLCKCAGSDTFVSSQAEINLTCGQAQAESGVDCSAECPGEVTQADIVLRDIFGCHLADFLREARFCKKGADVARLVKNYVREHNLKSDRLNKPLWAALKVKGIISIQVSAWNDAMT